MDTAESLSSDWVGKSLFLRKLCLSLGRGWRESFSSESTEAAEWRVVVPGRILSLSPVSLPSTPMSPVGVASVSSLPTSSVL